MPALSGKPGAICAKRASIKPFGSRVLCTRHVQASAARPQQHSAAPDNRQPGQALAAALLALSAFAAQPSAATAAELAQPAAITAEATTSTSGAAGVPTVYFGNGCFWGRQKDFVDTELSMGRPADQLSAVVGYAGGARAGPQGKVCYYYADPRTIYERLGHAEVVRVQLPPEGDEKAFKMFADTYFKQFRRLPDGRMLRLDPQDAGPGYRNVVGLPGGVDSPLFKVLQAANVSGMELRAGQGNSGEKGEGDLINVVWVVDSNKLPFYQAEAYHQFHNGLGKTFPASYTRDLKNQALQRGLIGSTGCPELPF